MKTARTNAATTHPTREIIAFLLMFALVIVLGAMLSLSSTFVAKRVASVAAVHGWTVTPQSLSAA